MIIFSAQGQPCIPRINAAFPSCETKATKKTDESLILFLQFFLVLL